MDSDRDKIDVLGKIDALLTRHRTAAPMPQDAAKAGQHAEREAIPVLTEIIAEPDTIPILTDAVTQPSPSAPSPEEQNNPAIPDSDTAKSVAQTNISTLIDSEASLQQLEEFLIQELENRIALEFTVALDHALEELLDRSREHIRHVVREALSQRAGKGFDHSDEPSQS